MRIRFIALDIDGTLLDSASAMPEANRQAVEAAVARGIEVALVTGRRFDFALPIAQQLACPLMMIVNNGALLKSKDGTTHLRHLLPRETAHAVLQCTPGFREGTAVIFDRPHENQVVYERIDWENPQRKSYFLRNRDFLGQLSPLEESLTEDPIQVMFTGPVAIMRQAEKVLDSAHDRARFALAVTYYESRDFGMVDVLHPRCSKGAMLAEWTALRGLAREEVMAIGDNFNDREMLEFAGLPIVMGNSVPELKELGWHQTLSNDDGGVAVAIAEHALGDT
jgi:5-amino-6-(5-phospho-D-ribitylamino)uracil phosphatase